MKRIPTYKIQAYLAGAVILLLNYFTVAGFIDHPDLLERLRHFLFWIDLGAFFSYVFLIRKREGLGLILKTSPSYNLLFLLCFLGALLVSNRIFPGKFKLLRLAFYLLAMIQMARAFVLTIVRNPFKLQPWVRNLAAFEYVLFFLLLMAEAAFLFPAKSRGAFPNSLSQINWNLRYQGPVNGQGMWEEPIPAKKPREKKQVFLLGDSFGAGWGIQEKGDRLPGQLEARFPNWQVWNLSIPGGNTRSETEVLKSVAWRPDLLIHAWVPNDIERMARSMGMERKELSVRSRMDFLPQALLYYSALFNYAEAEFTYPAEGGNYLNYLNRCFRDSALLAAHVEEIQALVREAAEAPTLHLLYPLMTVSEGDSLSPNSSLWTRNLSRELRKKSLPVIDLAPIIMEIPLEDRIVNASDLHPSALVQTAVGDTLKAWLEAHPEIP